MNQTEGRLQELKDKVEDPDEISKKKCKILNYAQERSMQEMWNTIKRPNLQMIDKI